jgi:hypothetical protein
MTIKQVLVNRFSVSCALGILCAVTSSAGPITLALNSWQTEPFTLMNPGGFFSNAYQASAAGTVDITGYYETGDYYQVYVDGTLILTTKQVSPINIDYGDQVPPLYADPGSAFSSGLFSTGHFTVNAGDLITIADLYPPSGIGEVGVELVPEPATFSLLGFGVLAAILLRRRLMSV